MCEPVLEPPLKGVEQKEEGKEGEKEMRREGKKKKEEY